MSEETRTPVEPERYELYADPAYRFDLARRDFFRLLGGGIVVLFLLPEAPEADAREFRLKGPCVLPAVAESPLTAVEADVYRVGWDRSRPTGH